MRAPVAVNGYGTIGKRVAEAIRQMPDLELKGIVKYTPDYSVLVAYRQGIPVYVPEGKEGLFEEVGVKPSGTIDELLGSVSLVVDASPGGKGAQNKRVYVERGLSALFEGGESPDVAEVSFSTLCNYRQALGKKYIRVVSCNTTALLRLICLLDRHVGVRKVRAVIVRRASDPKEDKGIVNTVKLDPPSIPSHHAIDVKTVLPGLDIETVALIVPTTLMHVHVVHVQTKRSTSIDEVVEALSSTPRVVFLEGAKIGIDSTSKIVEFARDLGRKRYDIYENVVWRDMVKVSGDELTVVQAVHQEAIVIPENIDAIRAALRLAESAEETMKVTDKVLNVGLQR
ncbi:type II glyceraldehyde-3-phosphate dehydrogenase [Thermogladius sp. KZ2Tp1]|uniref:type II glyceraldehyde-3-phosphate dehydrogenase n=1 Tax=unclassified Thermogladius TaxID=2647734 RepID=UPI003D0EFD4F